MAIAMLIDIPGLTQEQYEQMAQVVNQGEPTLERALIHLAGSLEGGCRVVEVWSSQEAANTFYTSALFGQLASQMTSPPSITTWPLYAISGPGVQTTT